MRREDLENYDLDSNFERQKQRQMRRRKKIKQKRRRRVIFRLSAIGIIFLVFIFGGIRLFSSNKKTVAKIETAIKTNDREYMNKHMDRLGVILDALKSSYSTNGKEAEEFLTNNFKNLRLSYIEEKSVNGGKEVTLEIENVNYVDIYNSLGEDKSHQAYMKALVDAKAPKKKARVTIFVTNKRFTKTNYESRPFVNAILGGALDYAN